MYGDKEKISKNIIILGLVSCFADISAEMVYPIMPLYLTAILGATPAIIGIIEGVAESLAGLLKVYSGYISDKYQQKKKIALIGYSTGLLYKLALLFSTSWIGLLSARIIDRFGKGIRTAPRDALVAESSENNKLGKSFGLHKALDMLGSAIGILSAYLILKIIGNDVHSYRITFVVSIIPVVIALFLFKFIQEKENDKVEVKIEKFWKNIKNIDNKLKLYLFVVFIFTLGNSSNSFLLLRANFVGFDSTNVVLLYFMYNAIVSMLAIPFGKLSDIKGRKKFLVLSYLMFSVVYFMFGLSTSKLGIILAFVLYGIYTAVVTGAERAFIAEISPKNLKATMLGMHGTIVGVALLPVSIIAGLLWDEVGAEAPFLFGALLSFIAASILWFGLKGNE